MPDFLTLDILKAKVGSRTVIKLFDDDNDGAITGTDLTQANAIMEEAEGEAYARLLRAYSDTTACATLISNDKAATGHAAWIALQFASERRSAFSAGDGSGQYSEQYKRAIEFFDALSRGRKRSAGESVAGTNPQVGGTIQPTMETDESRFIFAPDTDNPTGHGGF